MRVRCLATVVNTCHIAYSMHATLLFSHLCHLSSAVFSSGFPTKIFYSHPPSPMHATCQAYLILLDLIILISDEEYML
jgi:hypothetical protein